MFDTKHCARCDECKPVGAFHRRGEHGRQTWCKQCRRTYDAEYHARTREIRLARKRAANEALVRWYVDLKRSTPCADCGGTFHHAAMHWDHLPGRTKDADVSWLITRHSRRRILAEIEKCELVCANCHAVRTFNRQRGVAQPG